MAAFYGLKLSLKGVVLFLLPRTLTNTYMIFKKVTDTVEASQKLKSPLLMFGIYIYRCKPTLSEYLLVAVFNKPSYLLEKNNAYTVILGCKMRIKVLLLTFFFIAFVNQRRS